MLKFFIYNYQLFLLTLFPDSKEPEMEIGLPTDVKHVSHIGLEGASANQPSWVCHFSLLVAGYLFA